MVLLCDILWLQHCHQLQKWNGHSFNSYGALCAWALCGHAGDPDLLTFWPQNGSWVAFAVPSEPRILHTNCCHKHWTL